MSLQRWRSHFNFQFKNSRDQPRVWVQRGAMEIPGTTRKPIAEGAATDTKTQSIPSAPSTATEGSRVVAPTTTQQWSTDALLLRLIKLLESVPADQASAILRGLATKLYAAADRPDAADPRMHAWAERFEAAAQSGELSKLVPQLEPAAHFGIRAYQAAGQATAEQSELVALLRLSVAEANGGGPSHPSGPSQPSGLAEALALASARRGVAAVHVRRRLALAARRSRRRRRRRRARA